LDANIEIGDEQSKENRIVPSRKIGKSDISRARRTRFEVQAGGAK
jgi:hypothetical protein